MVRTLLFIGLALAILGAVATVAALMIVLLGQDWEDALLWILSAVMICSPAPVRRWTRTPRS